MSEFYKGKTALVTGASSGIGREITRELVVRGAQVIAVARRVEKVRELQEELKNMPGACIPFQADLQNHQQLTELVEQSFAKSRKIDILVNNAAVGSSKSFVDLDKDEIQQIYDTNLVGTTVLTHQVLRRMVKERSGNVVFVTSLAGKLGFPNLSAYSATKFGLEGLADSLRYEVGPDGVHITVLRPGVTGTEFFEVAGMQKFESEMKAKGKMGTPQQVAQELLDKLPENPEEIVVGPDKWFLKIMPIIPRKYRFRVLSLFS